jgi:hypothetical protein
MALTRPRLTIYRDKAGEWRWKLQSRNGQEVDSVNEGFTRRAYARARGERVAVAHYGSEFDVIGA